MPTTSTVPTAGVSENNPDTAAIIAGVTQALAQKGWVSHTTFTYNNYKKQLSKTIDVGYDSNGKVQTYTSHRHYDPINQLTETDDLDPNNASLHDPERDGDQDLISESYQYNLLGKTINKKLVPSSSTTSLVNSSPYYRQEHTTYDGLGDIESVGFSGADNSGTVTAETVYADPVFDSLGRVLSYTYLGITKGAHLDKTPYTYHTNYDAMGRKVASWVTNVSNQLPLYDPSDKSRGSLWPICRIYNPKTGQLSDIYYDTTATSGNAAKYCDATFGQAPAATSTNMLIHYNYDGLTGKMLAEVYPPATKGGKSRSISYKYYEPAAPTPSNVD